MRVIDWVSINKGVVMGESVGVCGCIFVFKFVGLYWCVHFFWLHVLYFYDCMVGFVTTL